jgi:hypothetical protein
MTTGGMVSRASLLLFALVLGSGCQSTQPGLRNPSDMRPTREPALAPEVTLEVVTKREPDALVARDGSNCRVAPDVFAATRVGSMFRCRWLQS